MSDFIRREDVVEALYQAIRTPLTGTFADSMSLAIAMANNLPSAEPERKKGKWIKHIDDLFPEESTEECSECHEMQFIWNGKCDKYCPNCGARMENE